MKEKDENLIIRPLVAADVEQYNALLRYSFQVTEQELSETGWKDDEIKQSKFPVIERADVLGCFVFIRNVPNNSSLSNTPSVIFVFPTSITRSIFLLLFCLLPSGYSSLFISSPRKNTL